MLRRKRSEAPFQSIYNKASADFIQCFLVIRSVWWVVAYSYLVQNSRVNKGESSVNS